MNIIFIIFAIIGTAIGLLLIIAIFSKKGYSLQRDIIINKPVAYVFNYIKHLKNQDYYSKWVMTDPNMQRNFTGIDGTEGFIYAWDSKNPKAGAGAQEIKGIVENKQMDAEIRFERPFKATAHSPFTTESINENTTKLTWGISSTMPYPMNIFLLFINIEKALGKDMDISLNNLKQILEK
jgi:hypothetical protein